jgi:hypothetical protein
MYRLKAKDPSLVICVNTCRVLCTKNIAKIRGGGRGM